MKTSTVVLIGLGVLVVLGTKPALNLKASSENAKKFAPVIAAAEKANGIPTDLLYRLIKQESGFRTDIITGAKKSAVGAVGIAQFMPATAAEWKLNPLDPVASINTAARYLVWLKNQTGGWTEAVASYNWGVGNVKKKGLARAPKETRDYVKNITGVSIA